MAKKIALGKGIASLIQETPNEILAKSLKEIDGESSQNNKSNLSEPVLVDISQIKPNQAQPRKIFKEKDLEELADSIKENGIIQPLIVMKSESGFELIAGERRLRAAKRAGLEKVPVVIKKVTDREKMVMAIIENVQRSDLNCVEEALAYYQLMDEYKLTQEEVAKKIGKERSTVANFLRILKLPRAVIEMIQKDLLTFGHAKVLASMKDRDFIIRAANEAVAEGFSVRDLEKFIKSGGKGRGLKGKTNPFFDERLDNFKQNLEQKTGFHFKINSKRSGAGQVIIKYSNEAEFNDIYAYLLER